MRSGSPSWCRRLRRAAFHEIRKRVKVQSFGQPGGGMPPGGDPRQPRRGDRVIDVDYEDVTPDRNGGVDPSGWTRH